MSELRVCARIDPDALRHNVRELKKCLDDGTKMTAVVKADAYGHGAVPCAAYLEEMPEISAFAVATAGEGVTLVKSGVKKPVFILGLTFRDDLAEAVRHGIGVTVCTQKGAEEASEEAQRQGRTADIFVAADTGMGRIGVTPDREGAALIAKIGRMPGIRLAGVFSHFARADETDTAPVFAQMERMNRLLDELKEEGVRIPLRMIANSAAILRFPETHLDMVRAGVAMYGLLPSEELRPVLAEKGITLLPVMSLVSHIVYIKTVEAGTSLSYGGIYTAKERRRIATIPVGYGDGYPRMLSDRAFVLIRGKRCPIRGRICMDQFMADVTEVPDAAEGDEVVLLGRQGSESITAEELGAISGRFNYELVCGISPRVPRVRAVSPGT